MDTHIERLVHADVEVVYELAARVENWPHILPHYRWVRVLEVAADGRRTVEMAARRQILPGVNFPLRWLAVQTLRPPESIIFQHVGGPTRGMHVAWSFNLLAGGELRVQIAHVFEPRWPVPDELVRLIVGEYFVNGVAARTLRCIGDLAEELSR
jgi:aromatase